MICGTRSVEEEHACVRVLCGNRGRLATTNGRSGGYQAMNTPGARKQC